MAFAKSTQARLPLSPALAEAFTTLQNSLYAADRNLLHLASTQASLPKPEVSLPRTLASPWTGLTPASYRELVAQLRHFNLLGVMTSELLDARKVGHWFSILFRSDGLSPTSFLGRCVSRLAIETYLPSSPLSIRACGSPAHGSPTSFVLRHAQPDSVPFQ